MDQREKNLKNQDSNLEVQEKEKISKEETPVSDEKFLAEKKEQAQNEAAALTGQIEKDKQSINQNSLYGQEVIKELDSISTQNQNSLNEFNNELESVVGTVPTTAFGIEGKVKLEVQEKSPLDEKFEREILPMLEALRPDDVLIEQFESETMNEIIDTIKKIQTTEGRLVENPEKSLDEAKVILKSRIKSALYDYEKYRYDESDKRPNNDFIRHAKLALLSVGDLSDFSKYIGTDELDVVRKKPGFDTFRYYLEIDKERKFTERELNEIVKAGFGENLASIPAYEFGQYFSAVPESYLMKLVEKNDNFWTNNLLENYPSKEKYSHNVFEELVKKGNGDVAHKNFKHFKNLNFKEAIDVYSPGYPFYVTGLINNLQTMNLSGEELGKHIDYVTKHQYVTDNDFNIPEIKEVYKDVIEKINILNDWKTRDKIIPENLEIAKNLIKDGHLGFLHESGKYLEEIVNKDYGYILEEAKKYDQEHLLASKGFLKPEDQLSYAKKLISQGKELSIIAGIQGRNILFSSKVFDQEIFDGLSKDNKKLNLSYFKDLNESTFEKLKNENPEKFFGHDLINNIESFKLESTDKYSKYIKYQEVLKLDAIYGYLNSYGASNQNKIDKVLNLIADSGPEERQKYSDLIAKNKFGGTIFWKKFAGSAVDACFWSDEKPLEAYSRFESTMHNFDRDIVEFMLSAKGETALGHADSIVKNGLPSEKIEIIRQYEKAFSNPDIRKFVIDPGYSRITKMIGAIKNTQNFDRLLFYNPDQQNEFVKLMRTHPEEISNFKDQNPTLSLISYIDIVENQDTHRFREEQKNEILELFKGQFKDKALSEIHKDWQEFLSGKINYAPPNLAVLSRFMEISGGAGNLKHVEALAGITSQLEFSLNQDTTVERTKLEVKDLLSRQEKRFDRDKWSHDDRSEFYNLSKSIIKASPSLYSSFSPVLEQMSGKDLKNFARDFLPLYQAQLVTLEKWKGERTEFDPRDLVGVRQGLFEIAEKLKNNPEDKESVLGEEKLRILNEIKRSFKTRFGLEKIPAQFDGESVRSIQNNIRYLGNINDRDQKKEAIVTFFLGLNLNKEWTKFRQGQPIDAGSYLSKEKLEIIQPILEERNKMNKVLSDNLGIGEKDIPTFQEILQEDSLNNMVGNIQTIDQKLGNIKRNIDELTDPDTYPEKSDKEIVALLMVNGKSVGAALSKTFAESSGKNISLTPAEAEIKNDLARIFDIDKWSPEKVKSIQDKIQPFGLISNMIQKMESENIDGKISELQKRLEPPENIINIFNRLGENFKPESGALAISQDITYLESLIVKDDSKLSLEEKQTTELYLNSIKEKMSELEALYDKTKEYFDKIKKSSHTGANEILKNRLNEIESIIYAKGDSSIITSRMTSDLNLVIENMRQCLGCLRKEANNDTNLAFGDYNKFFFMSQTEKEKGSMADEIMFFAPVTAEDGSKEMSFVFDRVYGAKSPDVFINHVATAYKKYQSLKQKFPDSKLSLTATKAALMSVGLDEKTFANRLKAILGDVKIGSESANLTANIPKSAFSDNYIEFGGGGARSSGDRNFEGLIIK